MVHLFSRMSVLCLAIVFLSFPAASTAQESVELNVDVAAICTGVSALEPVGFDESFPLSVGKLFCFTRIVGNQVPTTITHVWYYGDTERARVNLTVKSTQWRTYSSKIVQPHEIGSWHVDVLDSAGNVARTVRFTINADSGATDTQVPGAVQPDETGGEIE